MDLNEEVKKLQQEHDDLKKLRTAEVIALAEAKERLKDMQEAQSLAQEAAEQVQQQAHKQISYIVNKCLQVVFGDLYRFQIEFKSKRGKTEAELQFIKGGKIIDDVGGGCIDVAAFALQISSLLLDKNPAERVMFLDQPFNNVSEDEGYLEQIPGMLIMLAEEFGIQFIQVNHKDGLKIGKVIKL